eukprot:scaffold3762_cov118-Isochrysis_galbana.AAC.8
MPRRRAALAPAHLAADAFPLVPGGRSWATQSWMRPRGSSAAWRRGASRRRCPRPFARARSRLRPPAWRRATQGRTGYT